MMGPTKPAFDPASLCYVVTIRGRREKKHTSRWDSRRLDPQWPCACGYTMLSNAVSCVTEDLGEVEKTEDERLQEALAPKRPGTFASLNPFWHQAHVNTYSGSPGWEVTAKLNGDVMNFMGNEEEDDDIASWHGM